MWVEGRSRSCSRRLFGPLVHAAEPGAKRSVCGTEMLYTRATERRRFDPMSDKVCLRCAGLVRDMETHR